MAYNDSRHAAARLYRRLRLNWIFTTSTFAGNFLLALFITYFFRQLGYDDGVNYVFFMALLAIGLWVTEAIPPFAVGIFLIAGLLVGFSTDFILDGFYTPVDVYLGTWTSNVIWLLLGGFFLAEAMSIVYLDRKLYQFTIRRFGAKPDRLLLGLMLTTAVGSMVMSNTATTAMMISSILPLAKGLGKQHPYTIALLIGIPAAATLGGMGTIIGSTPNAIAVGALQERGISITFVEWMAFGLPTGLLSVYFFWRFLVWKFELKQMEVALGSLQEESREVSRFEVNAVLFTLIVTVSMWLSEPLHGIPVAATSAIPIVLLTLFQVIKAEHVRRLPWDTLMLVAGGLALGIAMVDVGLTSIIMEELDKLPIPIFGVVIVFSLLSVLISNVMSNTAAAAILVPLGLSLPGSFGVAVPLIVALSCSCACSCPFPRRQMPSPSLQE
ncbi:anion transporter [Nitritalea halalkaliphila LW7]|uniref:Anion transporter n=1 Tax=Nitritalea halalkaliphila LW7 TaxID=1189621 RepID=I5C2K8_9BACT|nr:SLC13 family permease [Nitritalea halalkaliphila]EIM76060.1 anion transporter [Nitritalea halalkaliphila LW7]